MEWKISTVKIIKLLVTPFHFLFLVTGSLKNIAVIYQTMGEYAKALPVLERELKIK